MAAAHKQDDFRRALSRHARRRADMIPTLTVISAEDPQAALATWRAWIEESGRPCAIASETGADAALRAWLEVAVSEGQLAKRAIERAAEREGRPVGDLALALTRSSEREAAMLCERVAASDRALWRALVALRGGDIAAELAGQLAGGIDVAGVAEILGRDRAPALAVALEDDDAAAALRAGAPLAEVATAAPDLPVALSAPNAAIRRLEIGPQRLAELVREGRIDVAAPPRAACILEPDAGRSRGAASGAPDPAPGPGEARRHIEALAGAAAAAAHDELIGAARAEDGDRARSAAERVLFLCLEATPQTAGEFELNGHLPIRFGRSDIEIDLLARRLSMAVEIDGPHHFRDRAAYRRDRRKDLLLQEQDHLVVRVLAADVMDAPASALETVVAAATRRRAALSDRSSL